MASLPQEARQTRNPRERRNKVSNSRRNLSSSTSRIPELITNRGLLATTPCADMTRLDVGGKPLGDGRTCWKAQAVAAWHSGGHPHERQPQPRLPSAIFFCCPRFQPDGCPVVRPR